MVKRNLVNLDFAGNAAALRRESDVIIWYKCKVHLFTYIFDEVCLKYSQNEENTIKKFHSTWTGYWEKLKFTFDHDVSKREQNVCVSNYDFLLIVLLINKKIFQKI